MKVTCKKGGLLFSFLSRLHFILHLQWPVAHCHLHRIVDGVTIGGSDVIRIEHDARQARQKNLNALKRIVVNDEEVEDVAEAGDNLAPVNLPLDAGHGGRCIVYHLIRVGEVVGIRSLLRNRNLIIPIRRVAVTDNEHLCRGVLVLAGGRNAA